MEIVYAPRKTYWVYSLLFALATRSTTTKMVITKVQQSSMWNILVKYINEINTIPSAEHITNIPQLNISTLGATGRSYCRQDSTHTATYFEKFWPAYTSLVPPISRKTTAKKSRAIIHFAQKQEANLCVYNKPWKICHEKTVYENCQK